MIRNKLIKSRANFWAGKIGPYFYYQLMDELLIEGEQFSKDGAEHMETKLILKEFF